MTQSIAFNIALLLLVPHLTMAFTSCNPGQAKSFGPVLPACRSGHFQITLDALAFNSHLTPDAVEAIAIANINVDVRENKWDKTKDRCGLSSYAPIKACLPGQCYSAAEHFDRVDKSLGGSAEAFKAGLQELTRSRTLFIARLHSAKSSSCSDLAAAIDALGHTLHTLQDAYSHSNYISLKAAQSEYDNAVRYPSQAKSLPSGMLLTGYDPDDKNPESPGQDPYPHCTHSKDFPGKNDDSAKDMYAVAYNAARNATELFMADLVAEVPASDWDKLAFVADCPALTTYKGVSITSNDPNDKTGLIGVGPSHFLQGNDALQYYIYFENTPNASASAQDVIVNDLIDKTKIDLTSLRLGPLSFAGRTITMPTAPLSSLGSVTQNVDLRPEVNLIARVTVSMAEASGLLTWHFESIDTMTGKPTVDPVFGFLPIGGEGDVTFSAQLASGLATNTDVSNQAIVIFDGKPLATSIWSNRLDNTAPVTKVLALPPMQTTNSFVVNWSGSDTGVGLRDYTISVSDNTGPFQPWLTGTALTSTSFVGTIGHSYAFKSSGRDLVGNVEAAKSAAEAMTLLVAPVAPTPPPIITPQLPQLTSMPAGLTFVQVSGGTAPPSQALLVSSTDTPLSFTTSSTAPWIKISEAGRTGNALSVSVDGEGLPIGTASGILSLSSTEASNVLRIPITLTIRAWEPRVDGVVSSGTLAAGAVSPGSIASMFGDLLSLVTLTSGTPLPTKSGNITISVAGRPAPLFYVSPTQINFQVPYGIPYGPVTGIFSTPTQRLIFNIQIAPHGTVYFPITDEGGGCKRGW